MESAHKIPQERLLFERIEEQIGHILVPPIVEDTVEVDQKFPRIVVQAVVSLALQVVAPHPDVADGDTGFESSWSWCISRRFKVIRIGDRDNAGRIRVIHANENPSDWKSGSWIHRRFFRPDGKRARLHP